MQFKRREHAAIEAMNVTIVSHKFIIFEYREPRDHLEYPILPMQPQI